jgi:hypothetical protein
VTSSHIPLQTESLLEGLVFDRLNKIYYLLDKDFGPLVNDGDRHSVQIDIKFNKYIIQLACKSTSDLHKVT